MNTVKAHGVRVRPRVGFAGVLPSAMVGEGLE